MFPELQVKRLVQNAIIPTRGSAHAAGYDLYSVEDCSIPHGGRLLVGTGVAVVLPSKVYGRVAPRSGLTVKHGIHVGAGVMTRITRAKLRSLFLISVMVRLRLRRETESRNSSWKGVKRRMFGKSPKYRRRNVVLGVLGLRVLNIYCARQKTTSSLRWA